MSIEVWQGLRELARMGILADPGSQPRLILPGSRLIVNGS